MIAGRLAEHNEHRLQSIEQRHLPHGPGLKGRYTWRGSRRCGPKHNCHPQQDRTMADREPE